MFEPEKELGHCRRLVNANSRRRDGFVSLMGSLAAFVSVATMGLVGDEALCESEQSNTGYPGHYR